MLSGRGNHLTALPMGRSVYVDLLALRRSLWCGAVLVAWWPVADQPVWSCAANPLPPIHGRRLCVALVALAMAVEVSWRVLAAAGMRGAYLAIQLSCPPVQVPFVERAFSSGRQAALASAAGACTIAAAVLACSPWPLLVAAAAVGVHALLLLFPTFGRLHYWRLHYSCVLPGATPAYEEWFTTAEHAAQANLPSSPAAQEVA